MYLIFNLVTINLGVWLVGWSSGLFRVDKNMLHKYNTIQLGLNSEKPGKS